MLLLASPAPLPPQVPRRPATWPAHLHRSHPGARPWVHAPRGRRRGAEQHPGVTRCSAAARCWRGAASTRPRPPLSVHCPPAPVFPTTLLHIEFISLSFALDSSSIIRQLRSARGWEAEEEHPWHAVQEWQGAARLQPAFPRLVLCTCGVAAALPCVQRAQPSVCRARQALVARRAGGSLRHKAAAPARGGGKAPGRTARGQKSDAGAVAAHAPAGASKRRGCAVE